MSDDCQEIEGLLRELFPICRSLSGPGNDATFEILRKHVDLQINSVPSGSPVFDWIIPPEWTFRRAYVDQISKDGRISRVVDTIQSNLHIVNYSAPFRGRLNFKDLVSRLHFSESLPDAIPYRTNYFSKDWGFCLSKVTFDKLDRNAEFEVVIDSDLNESGTLKFATQIKRGRKEQEILISTYCCHPSLANDNLSGLITATLLFKWLNTIDTEYSYRLVIAPETIGVIAFLYQFKDQLRNLIGGAVVTTNGGPGQLGLKESFLGNSMFDRAAKCVLNSTGQPWKSDNSEHVEYIRIF
jgi:aminopeptidase-like protein